MGARYHLGLICGAAASFLLALLGLAPGRANEAAVAIPVYPGCDTPNPRSQGRIFYIDPARGSPTNDGSRERPWRTLAETLEAKAGLIATRSHAGRDSAHALVPVNPAAPIRPGDTLMLASGDYGDVDLHDYSNEQFISIVAAPGETPVISSLNLGAASHWLFRGISFRGAKQDVEAKKFAPMVGVGTTYRGVGQSDNLILIGNSFATQDNVEGWSPQDWVEKPLIYALQSVADCVSLVDNHFFNLRNAVGLFGDRTLLQTNSFEHIGNDAVDFAASNLIIRGNVVRDGRHTPAEPLHPDAFQGWSVNDHVNRNVVIDSNRVINLTSGEDGLMQGVSIFAGRWNGLDVVNNLVITNIWHGIALYGVENARVFNNTVLSARPNKATTWLTVAPAKDGQPSRHVVVRNNIATALIVSGEDIQFDHNIMLKTLNSTRNRSGTAVETLRGEHNALSPETEARFVDYDLKAQHFDLRPNRASPARESGAEEGAPAVDIDGRRRIAPYDIGAFAR